MIPGPIIGTGLHTVGGIAASTCYTPYEKMSNWSWVSFWPVQALFAWFLVPMVLGIITVPDFFSILFQTPSHIIWGTFLLGGLYGFGSMSFGFAIKHIGFSLTFAISIGISAVFGTITPLIIEGTLVQYFLQPGGDIVLLGMILSVVGVAFCGFAGFIPYFSQIFFS